MKKNVFLIVTCDINSIALYDFLFKSKECFSFKTYFNALIPRYLLGTAINKIHTISMTKRISIQYKA